MDILKKNIKWIILVIVLIMVASGISVYATSNYLATQVNYTRNNTTKSVSDALDELYSMKDNKYTEEQYQNYGITQYNKAIADNGGIVMENFTLKNGTNFYEIGFNAKLVFITFAEGRYNFFFANNTSQYSVWDNWHGKNPNVASIENNGITIKNSDGVDYTGCTLYAVK